MTDLQNRFFSALTAFSSSGLFMYADSIPTAFYPVIESSTSRYEREETEAA